MSGMRKDDSSHGSKMKWQENQKTKSHHIKDAMPGSELWTDGLLCAFEYIVHKKSLRSKSHSKIHSTNKTDSENIQKQVPIHELTEASTPIENRRKLIESTSLMELGDHCSTTLDDDLESQTSELGPLHSVKTHAAGSHWVPIGWTRISELVQTVQVDAGWVSHQFDIMDDEDDLTVADLAAPYWERPGGPRWWCHVAAGHPVVDAWLRNAQWLHPAVSIALRDESRLISDRMKHLLYEVPVRVAGGLLFELLGQSAGDPFVNEDDIPIVLRSWQAQNFLITALHVKGPASSLNVLGIMEVQEQLFAGGSNSPTTVHGVIAHLATRLARWDDRFFRKSIFGEADAVELKFMNRRNHEDLNLFSVILNQEIRRLSRQVIRVKWSLHAREEIVFELLQHLRGNTTKSLLEGIRKSTREMIEEQEAVRGRLFTIQDVMQSTVRAWLQDRSLRVTHNLTVFGGCGLVLSIITGLFGINVDGMPGADNTPYAFGLFSAVLFSLGIVLIAVGLLYLGLKQPVSEEQVQVRKLELQELVKMFQHEAETHAQVRKNVSRHNLPPTNADKFLDDADYLLIH
ncbi:uncharacterized protein LOC131310532 [Rhododendron vialii]|uniref:uncharacterized protein LOC131310532 n=1 Tax=Rhododendron vialii TaxID=182163 RepID=UPI00265F3F3B|nr:uncharacterized protein LOC131310532 [Rhododendron vialii]XP_058193584.1 uncharacterized protein LOC131310532 [Rhododendron vialii]XP_058193585.1 uncharacterized protein LOC131310532 [Rhododendron vialii]XP_058193586.1 uncharacterized protein LOC131310532 [Rhododendron vialii]